MKTLCAVIALMMTFGSCETESPKKEPEPKVVAEMGPGDGVIDKQNDQYNATDVTVPLCNPGVDQATARWTRAETAEDSVKIMFNEMYRCLFAQSVYAFSVNDPVELTLSKADFCDSCSVEVRTAMLQNGIAANMFIRVGSEWITVHGPSSPPRILIGGGTPGLIGDCCQ